MQAHTIQSRAIVYSIGVFAFVFGFQLCAMSEDHTQGFPPLAKVRLAVSEAQIPFLMDVLHQFARDESLKIAHGEFQRDGRGVQQLTLKLNDGTFYFMSNFRNKDHFELTAYSHADPSAWKPIWLRLVNKLVQVLGPENVESEMSPDRQDS